MAEFIGSTGDDTVDATTGQITGFTGASAVELNDTLGDTFRGDSGGDFIRAGGASDLIYGGFGIDTMYGGAGDDTFSITQGDGDAASETFDGGQGIDTLLLRDILSNEWYLTAATVRSIERIDLTNRGNVAFTASQVGNGGLAADLHIASTAKRGAFHTRVRNIL